MQGKGNCPLPLQPIPKSNAKATQESLVVYTEDWTDPLEGRGPRLYLIALLDDATSQATACFVGHDSTEQNLRMLGGYVKAQGRPLAVYTDKEPVCFRPRPRESITARRQRRNPRRSDGR
jgi:hypothetical protein